MTPSPLTDRTLRAREKHLHANEAAAFVAAIKSRQSPRAFRANRAALGCVGGRGEVHCYNGVRPERPRERKPEKYENEPGATTIVELAGPRYASLVDPSARTIWMRMPVFGCVVPPPTVPQTCDWKLLPRETRKPTPKPLSVSEKLLEDPGNSSEPSLQELDPCELFVIVKVALIG